MSGTAVSYLHVECLRLWGGLGRLVLLLPLLAEAQGAERCAAGSLPSPMQTELRGDLFFRPQN